MPSQRGRNPESRRTRYATFALEFARNPNNPANNGDCASGADHNQSRSNDRPFDTTPTQQGRQAAGNSHYRHSMLLRHRPAELLRSSGRDTQCPHVCREKCEHSAQPACDGCPIYPHRSVARSHKYKRICKSIRQFIEDLSRFRRVPTFDGNHSVEKIAQKAQLDQQGRNQEKPPLKLPRLLPVQARQRPAPPAKSALATEIPLGRTPRRDNQADTHAAHRVLRALIERRAVSAPLIKQALSSRSDPVHPAFVRMPRPAPSTSGRPVCQFVVSYVTSLHYAPARQ